MEAKGIKPTQAAFEKIERDHPDASDAVKYRLAQAETLIRRAKHGGPAKVCPGDGSLNQLALSVHKTQQRDIVTRLLMSGELESMLDALGYDLVKRKAKPKRKAKS